MKTKSFHPALSLSLICLFFAAAIIPMACGDGDGSNPVVLNDGQENQDENDDVEIITEPTPVEPQCEPGQSYCDDECVDTSDDPRHCGRCGDACEEGQICSNRRCESPDQTCPQQPCTGFTYCDGNTGICRPGCADDDQCLGGQICDTNAYECTCPEGQRLCGGKCYDLDDPEACGDCMVCPNPSNATAQCVDGQCSLTCDEGLLRCGDRCAQCPQGASEVGCEGNQCVATACGEGDLLCDGQCASCPSGATEVGCEGSQCVATACPDGQRPCGGDCASCPTDFVESTTCEGAQCVAATCDQSSGARNACGGECVACPEGGDSYSCDGNQCVVDCGAGQHLCGDTCVDSSDPDHCGDRCSPCPTATGGDSQCIEERCQIVCDDDRYPCEQGCCALSTTEMYTDDETNLEVFDLAVDDQGNLHLAFLNLYGDTFYAHNSGGSWQIEELNPTMDEAAEEDFIAITVDGDGDPVIFVYVYDSDAILGGRIVVAWRPDGSSWSMTDVDTITGGEYTGLAAATNGNGKPIVVYATEASTNLELRMATLGSTSATYQVIDSDIGYISGGYPDLAVDSDGDPHVLYNDYSGDGAEARYAWRSGSNWQDEFVDITYSSHFPGTIAIAGDGTPAVLLDHDDLYYAERSGGAWSAEIVDDTTLTINPRLALDSNGVPHVAFIDYYDESITYGHRLYGDWTLNTVPGAENADNYSGAIAFGLVDDAPKIFFVDGSDDSRLMFSE